MKIDQYVQEYTHAERVKFLRIFVEVGELFEAIFRFDRKGIKEEYQDVLHFVQLWLYWRFGLNQEMWNCTKDSVNKFMSRKQVWQDMYEFVGLPRDISNQCSNYKRKEKVIKCLRSYGIERGKAVEAYNVVVLNKAI